MYFITEIVKQTVFGQLVPVIGWLAGVNGYRDSGSESRRDYETSYLNNACYRTIATVMSCTDRDEK